MRRPLGRRAIAGGAVLLAALLGLAVPATSGAFTAGITNPTDTAGAATRISCAATFAGTTNRSNAYFEYALTGTDAVEPDAAAPGSPGDAGYTGNAGLYRVSGSHPTAAATATTACPNDPGSYYVPDGTSNYITTSKQLTASPTEYSLVIWFSTQRAGYLMGLNNSAMCDGGQFDRHIYVDANGLLEFGVYDYGTKYAMSTARVDDGLWHQAVATMSSTAGMSLWLDGRKVGTNPGTTGSESNTGYWCIGRANMNGWKDPPASVYFAGGLRFAAAYRGVLSDGEIVAEYADGRPGA